MLFSLSIRLVESLGLMSKPEVNIYTAGYAQWKDQQEFFNMVYSF